MTIKTLLRTLLRAIYMLPFFSTIFGCGERSTAGKDPNDHQLPASEYTVSSVNEVEFLFNNNEAGLLIAFEQKDKMQCSLSFIRTKFIDGYSTRVITLGEGGLDLTCIASNAIYTLDKQKPTFAEISLKQQSTHIMAITLSFNLYSVREEKFFSKRDINLYVDKNLIHP